MKKSVILMLLLAGCSTANYVVSDKGHVRYKDAVKSSRFGDEADVYDCNKIGSDYTLFCDKDGSPYYGNVKEQDKAGTRTFNLEQGNIISETLVGKDGEEQGHYYVNGSNDVWGAYYSLNKKHLPSEMRLEDGRYVSLCEDGKVNSMKFDGNGSYSNFTIDGKKRDGMIYFSGEKYGSGAVYTINDTPITGAVKIFDCENNLMQEFPLVDGKINGEKITIDEISKESIKFIHGRWFQKTTSYFKGTTKFWTRNNEKKVEYNKITVMWNVDEDEENAGILGKLILKLNDQEVFLVCLKEDRGFTPQSQVWEDPLMWMLLEVRGQYTPQSPEWEDIKKSGFKCPQKVSKEL